MRDERDRERCDCGWLQWSIGRAFDWLTRLNSSKHAFTRYGTPDLTWSPFIGLPNFKGSCTGLVYRTPKCQRKSSELETQSETRTWVAILGKCIGQHFPWTADIFPSPPSDEGECPTSCKKGKRNYPGGMSGSHFGNLRPLVTNCTYTAVRLNALATCYLLNPWSINTCFVSSMQMLTSR